jgi:hypothetical protein
MSCEGFSAGEDVTITGDGSNLTTVPADADGSVSTGVQIPDNPGHALTLQADGERSGKHASATFTIEETTTTTSTGPTTTPPSG